MFETILLSAAGVWVALFGIAALGSLIWASEIESFWLGLGVIIIGLAIANFLLGIPVFAVLQANLLLAAFFAVVFVAVGTVYAAMWRLPNFVDKHSSSIAAQYDNWKTNRSPSRRKNYTGDRNAPDEATLDISYETFLKSNSYRYSVRNNKDVVASWVLLWPVSMLWELSHKPFRWVWNKVYYGIGRVLEEINYKAAKNILEKNAEK